MSSPPRPFTKSSPDIPRSSSEFLVPSRKSSALGSDQVRREGHTSPQRDEHEHRRKNNRYSSHLRSPLGLRIRSSRTSKRHFRARTLRRGDVPVTMGKTFLQQSHNGPGKTSSAGRSLQAPPLKNSLVGCCPTLDAETPEGRPRKGESLKFRAELDPLRPYVPPKSWRMAAEGKDGNSYAKLTSNELAFGPLPEAEAALAEMLPRANRYPDSPRNPSPPGHSGRKPRQRSFKTYWSATGLAKS